MTASQLENVGQQTSIVIEANTLLDSLYTYYPLNELEGMLLAMPDDDTLSVWNVSLAEYRAVVRQAIDYVAQD